MSQTVGLDDELLSAATAAFLAHPDTLASFVTAMSAIFIDRTFTRLRSLAAVRRHRLAPNPLTG